MEASTALGDDHGTWTLCPMSKNFTYCDSYGSVSVPHPVFTCSRCQHSHSVHPVSARCFPATPTLPQVWYGEDLLTLVSSIQTRAPYSTRAVIQVVKDQHNSRCAAPLEDSTVANLGSAARASRCIQPLNTETPFLPETQVHDQLTALRSDVPAREQEEHQCAKFKAAPTIIKGTRLQHYDRLGVAALCCRHEQVLVACSMFTEENHTYYEILLEHLYESYNSNTGRKLSYFFLDIACRFKHALQRVRDRLVEQDHPCNDLVMAVGSWHLLPHKARCHVEFNPNYMQGVGLTAGDCIEHLWANLRKYNGRAAYMGDANRQDLLSSLAYKWHEMKVEGLPKQLLLWFLKAKGLKAKLAQELAAETPTGPVPSPRDRLLQQPASGPAQAQVRHSWEFEYVGCIDKVVELVAALKGLQAGTTAREAKQAELDKAQGVLERLERQHGINTRWRQGCREYQDADKRWTIYLVQQQELKIEGALVHYCHNRDALGRASRTASRHETTRLSKRMSTWRGVIKDSISQLKELHRRGLKYGESLFKYDADKLTVDSVTVDGVQGLPWDPSISMPTSLDDKVQRYLRAEEEMGIIRREARDMVAFYEHYVCQYEGLLARLEHDLQDIAAGSYDADQRALREKGYLLDFSQEVLRSLISSAMGRLAQSCVKGMMHSAQRKLVWLQGQLRKATELVAGLETGDAGMSSEGQEGEDTDDGVGESDGLMSDMSDTELEFSSLSLDV